jgi:hypothetical protein
VRKVRTVRVVITVIRGAATAAKIAVTAGVEGGVGVRRKQ